MKVDEMAATLGLTIGAISAWETGRTAPSEERLGSVAKAYGIPIEDLLPLPERRDRFPGRIEIVGSHLKTVRESRGHSQATLAEAAGLSATAISQWESANARPHWRDWAKVCAVLDRDPTSREDVISSHHDLREIESTVGRVGEIRRSLGLSQPQFATLIGADSTMVSKIENGHRSASPALAYRIWKVYSSRTRVKGQEKVDRK